jgi:hypothetical protein
MDGSRLATKGERHLAPRSAEIRGGCHTREVKRDQSDNATTHLPAIRADSFLLLLA